MRRRIALLFVVLFLGAPAARAQIDSHSSWQIGIGAALGVPDGWVQVREGEIGGTRLRFRRDLHVTRVHAFELRAEYRPRPSTGIGLTVASWALNGTTRLPADVLFNATTLAGGSLLTTRTDFPHFIRITIEGWRRIASLGGDGSLSGSVGLTATLLTFEMHGTEAPNSVGHESREDFVTQELPVPVVGFRARYSVTSRVAASVGLSGGYLPWINSLRLEGGEVRITQSHAEADIGAAYAIRPSLRVTAGFRYSDFIQREKSREDGNDIHLRAALLTLGFAHSF